MIVISRISFCAVYITSVNTWQVLSYKKKISVKLWIYDNPSANTARMIWSVEFPIAEPQQSTYTPQLQSPPLVLLSIPCSFPCHTLSLSLSINPSPPPFPSIPHLFLSRTLSVSLYFPLIHSIFLSISITLYIFRETLRTRSGGRMARWNLLNRRFHHFGGWRAFYPRFMCSWSSGQRQNSTTEVSVKYNLMLHDTFHTGGTRVMR